MEFSCGRTNTTDAERSGRPIEITTEEIIHKIHDIVLENSHMKMCNIAEKVNISKERTFNIFHEHSGMIKISVRWVSQLTVDQKMTNHVM